ncbi:hypothetical protein E3N88_07162 [Mikania micrantha]|uniref:Secreted protein n=1 Tax=Mikania micrantha TaxID=192012 RepID=A0A5N6PS52_9ASTR|nr:hypothetical protein E3N88_07162 [Mikania micrantha]
MVCLFCLVCIWTSGGQSGFDRIGAHRGTRWPNKKHRCGTRQTSRRVDSRIPSRSVKHLSGLSPRYATGVRRQIFIKPRHHHHKPPYNFIFRVLIDIITPYLHLQPLEPPLTAIEAQDSSLGATLWTWRTKGDYLDHHHSLGATAFKLLEIQELHIHHLGVPGALEGSLAPQMS